MSKDNNMDEPGNDLPVGKRFSCIGTPPLPDRLIDALAALSARLYAEDGLKLNVDDDPAVIEGEDSDET